MKIGRSHKDLPILSSFQEDILIGSMLGDGYLTKADKFNSKFCKKQHYSRKEYLNWHFTSLREYSANIKEIYSKEVLSQGLDGKIIRNVCDEYLSSYEYTTYSHPNLTILRNKWYISNKKTIPHDLFLNPLRIAVWYFDDGCNSKKNRCITLCTQSFEDEEVFFLQEKLKNFDICSKIIHVVSRYTGRKMPMMRICGDSYDNMINLVKPYMLWDCFSYKIESRIKLNNHTRKPISQWKNYPYKLSENDVIEIIKKQDIYSQHEIAKMFGVKQTTISAILSGKTWKHINR